MEANLKERIKQIIKEQIVTCGNKQIEDIDFETCGEDYAIFFKAGIKEVVKLSLNAIAGEPEFPGDMPDELWVELNSNRGNVDLAMKNAVRLTKKGITKRLQAQLKEWGIKEEESCKQ